MGISGYTQESIIKGAQRAGEVLKRALTSGGACLIITVEKLPEGLDYKYFHLCFLGPEGIQQVYNDHPYLRMAQEAEERMKAEITASGAVN